MSYHVFIIEDEPDARDYLINLLKTHHDFQVQGTAETIEKAKQLLESIQPDLVFLDIRLGPNLSFDLLQSLSSISFEIIFTTSYQDFAVRAFRLSAIDYLLKPLVPEELAVALERFRHKKKNNSDQIKNLIENLLVLGNPKIALPTLTGFLFVPVKEIIRCESDNTYTTFFTTDKRKIIVSKTLKECEQMLTGYRFYRVHNSHLINIDFIAEYIKGEGGIVKMADGTSVDVSRRRKDDFLRAWKRNLTAIFFLGAAIYCAS